MNKDSKIKIINKVVETKLVNNETGEILQEEQIIKGIGEKEPDYVKMYLEDITALKHLPKGLDKVIYSLLRLMSYENMIILNSYIKTNNTELEYKTVQVLNNNINKLVKSGILFRQGTGTYQVNAKYFGKGN